MTGMYGGVSGLMQGGRLEEERGIKKGKRKEEGQG